MREEHPLPCPFCGSEDIEYEISGSQGYMTCNDCGTLGPEAEMAADPFCCDDAAISAWNKRKTSETEDVFNCGISLRMLRVLCGEAEKRGLHPDLVALEETRVAENSVGDLAIFLWRTNQTRRRPFR